MKTKNTLKRTLSLLLAVLMLVSVAAVPVSAVSAPAAPSKVVADADPCEVKLTWSKVSGATGYRIYYKQPGDTSWKRAISSTTSTSALINVLKGRAYIFAVRSYVKSGSDVIWGGYKEVTTVTPPTIPKHFESEQNASAIKIRWTWLPEADGYRIYYRTSPSASWKTAVPSVGGGVNTYTFKNLPAGKRYYFAVRAYVKTAYGTAFGKPRYLETATKPATPTAKASTTASSITLSWNKVSADGYRIYYKSGSSDWKVAVSTTAKTTHTFKNLPANKTYTFAVRPYIKTPEKVIWGGYKQFNATTKATLAVPSTKAELASAYNNAINEMRAYSGTVTVKQVSDIYVEVTDAGPATSIINDVVKDLVGDTVTNTHTFKNGVDSEGGRLIEKTVPYGRKATLRPAGIAAAAVTANVGGGYTMKFRLVEEKSYFNGNTTTMKTTYHNDVVDVLDFAGLDVGSSLKVTSAEAHYTGTVITAVVDVNGRLTGLNINMPFDSRVSLKMSGLSMLMNLDSRLNETYRFSYK